MFPSVTEVLSPWADFSKIPPDVLAHAAARGTAVHDVCATIARGLPVLTVPSAIDGYVNSYRRWFDLMVEDVILVEERLVDINFGYNGEPDLVIRSKQKQIILVDNKTPVSLLKTWQLQCAGYWNLASKQGITPDVCGSLRLHPDGKVAKMEYYKNSALDFNLFLQALSLHRFFYT